MGLLQGSNRTSFPFGVGTGQQLRSEITPSFQNFLCSAFEIRCNKNQQGLNFARLWASCSSRQPSNFDFDFMTRFRNKESTTFREDSSHKLHDWFNNSIVEVLREGPCPNLRCAHLVDVVFHLHWRLHGHEPLWKVSHCRAAMYGIFFSIML